VGREEDQRRRRAPVLKRLTPLLDPLFLFPVRFLTSVVDGASEAAPAPGSLARGRALLVSVRPRPRRSKRC
jgi:hypothetical protein